MDISFSESVVRFKAMVKELGKEVFDYEASKLRDEMKSHDICPELINQVILVLECSPAKKYLLSSSRVSTSDLNNMMSQISLCTGLKESIAFNLLNIMCEAAGVPFTVDPGPYLTKDKKVAFEVRKCVSKEASEQKLKIAEQYIRIDDCASEGYQMLTELAEEGNPRAFYLLGKYYYDLAAEGDSIDVPYTDYLVVAAEQGIPEASLLLGDIYYKTNRIIGHDNTQAFYFYSKPGVGHFDDSHKEKVKELFSQKNKNFATMVLEGIAIAVMIAFLIFFNRGIVADTSKIVFGILSVLSSVGVMVGSVFYNKKNKYNSLKWALCCIGLLWLFYLFFIIMG